MRPYGFTRKWMYPDDSAGPTSKHAKLRGGKRRNTRRKYHKTARNLAKIEIATTNRGEQCEHSGRC